MAVTGCSCAVGQSASSDRPNRVERVVAANKSGDALERFGSDAELEKFLDDLKKAQSARASKGLLGGAMAEGAESAAAPPSAAPAEEAEDADGEGITNNQEQGVDEGGIVKVRGDHLVVLRRGRLFTVKIGDASMTPVSAADVRPSPQHDAWYDEMLIHDDTVIVIGYSYQASATEIGIFDLADDGTISRRDTHFLRSNDYYSSRNYASRLLDDKLVFYMPYWLSWSNDLPGMTRYDGDETYDDWHEVIGATTIYRPIQDTPNPVLHTVVTCDLAKSKRRGKGMDCSAEGIVGPAGRSFYVSKNAVYVWAHPGFWHRDPDAQHDRSEPPATVYRLPLDGGDMGALRTWGAPVDQFSFKEGDDGHLNVLVRAEAPGDFMWGAELSNTDQFDPDTALLRVPLDVFGQGVQTANAGDYTDLPNPTGNAWAMQNRFVGDHVIYGVGFGWAPPSSDGQETTAYVHRYAGDEPKSFEVPLPHAVDRIEALGRDAVIVGSDGRDLHFTALDLDRRPAIAGRYVQTSANQGETRSHGFFFRQSGDERGVLGLPIRGGAAPGYEHLINGSASLLFLTVDKLRFFEAGQLRSDAQTPQDDRCQVSCVDWYGNARPIFYRDRVFALLGYELVEGELVDGQIRELRRTNMLSALR